MSAPGPESRLIPLRRSVCFACALVWILWPTFVGVGGWAVFAWVTK